MLRTRTFYPSAARNFLLRFRDAFSRAVMPSRSGMSGEAPCVTSHFRSAGSNSFSMPMCSAALLLDVAAALEEECDHLDRRVFDIGHFGSVSRYTANDPSQCSPS